MIIPAQHGVIASSRMADSGFTWIGLDNPSGVSFVASTDSEITADLSSFSGSAYTFQFQVRADAAWTATSAFYPLSMYVTGVASGSSPSGFRLNGVGTVKYDGANKGLGVPMLANGVTDSYFVQVDGTSFKVRFNGTNYSTTIASTTWEPDGAANCRYSGSAFLTTVSYDMTVYKIRMTSSLLSDAEMDAIA